MGAPPSSERRETTVHTRFFFLQNKKKTLLAFRLAFGAVCALTSPPLRGDCRVYICPPGKGDETMTKKQFYQTNHD